ncbi:transcriptional adapter 2-alpha [Fonsecaea erecta]|uniref:Transcriptional adapter 2 n=1 Tax=Fonsecaea erecta TaxID=1367422 RepID=A0A178ZJW1_9EURO|nr:transcriptional adapter 2-alpha [Fonsecaea erecta]OAP60089.1 transcriptional adapter 2-alpha [Fonsecaea erecta]
MAPWQAAAAGVGGGYEPPTLNVSRTTTTLLSLPATPLSPPSTLGTRSRPVRSSRKPVNYIVHSLESDSEGSASPTAPRQRRDPPADAAYEDATVPAEYAQYFSSDSDCEEDARIERSMGVIRKNAASRGGDGGTKYHCDVCSIDITSTVRISCANPACREYDLCVPCFARGEHSKNHDPRTHEYHVVEQNSIPIYTEDWGADEELLLLEGSERYGLGSWADVAEHIGGYREKDEVRDHYINTYINSSLFPLPELADPADTRLFERIPKDEFQARKKRRIEERKEAAKSAPPATPKQKPTASVPACHEVQGFMPGRLEFETEFANDAEEAVQHMSFEPGDGLDPVTGQMDEETTLKMTVFDIYNSRLKARTDRKRIIFEHNLLEYKKNQLIDKKRTKEEKDLLHRAKPFARMMNHEDFEALNRDLLLEHNLRIAIAQLQEWKQMGISDLRGGEKYEADKQARAIRNQPQGQFDRMPQIPKKGSQIQQPDLPTEASKLTTPELPLRFQRKQKTVPQFTDSQPAVQNDFDKLFAEASGPDSSAGPKPKVRYVVQPLNGTTPWKLEEDKAYAPDLQLLSEEEIQLCNTLHIRPKPYLALKEGLLKEAMKQGGQMKKKEARGVCRIDVNKANRIFDFMIHSGWIAKA